MSESGGSPHVLCILRSRESLPSSSPGSTVNPPKCPGTRWSLLAMFLLRLERSVNAVQAPHPNVNLTVVRAGSTCKNRLRVRAGNAYGQNQRWAQSDFAMKRTPRGRGQVDSMIYAVSNPNTESVHPPPVRGRQPRRATPETSQDFGTLQKNLEHFALYLWTPIQRQQPTRHVPRPHPSETAVHPAGSAVRSPPWTATAILLPAGRQRKGKVLRRQMASPVSRRHLLTMPFSSIRRAGSLRLRRSTAFLRDFVGAASSRSQLRKSL